jgi:hypothetical protein
VIQNGFDIPENNSRLIFVLGKTHDCQSLAHGDERTEVDEAGDETGDQSGDERFAATPANDEIGFLRSIDWRSYASSVALKNDEIIGSHGQAENGFQHHKPSSPRL